MNAILLAALANAALAVPLAVLAALSRGLNRPALTHALWVLVLLKLLTPPLLDVPMIPAHLAPELPIAVAEAPPIPDPVPIASAATEPVAAAAVPRRSEVAAADPRPSPIQVPRPAPVAIATAPAGDLGVVPTAVTERSSPEPAAEGLSIRPGAILSIVWAGGAFVVLAVQVHRLVRFRRFLRSACPSPDLSRQAAGLADSMGLTCSPRVRLLPGVVSPMLWGVGPSATILFPERLAERLDDDARGSLLAHELAHYGRGDQWVRLLELASGVLYWWHPAVWMARRGIEAAGEDCADAWVVERYRSRPRCYAAALLDAVDFLAAGPTATVPGVTGLGTAAALRHRLTRIMRGPAPRALSRPARAAVVLLVFTLPLQPALFEMAGSASLASVSAELDPTDLFAPAATKVETDESSAPQHPVRLPEPLAPLPGDHVWATAKSGDGRFLLESRLDGVATLRDVRDRRTTTLPLSRLTAADFSPDGRSLVLGDAEGRLALCDAATGRIEGDFASTGAAVTRSLCFSPGGDQVAVATDGGVSLLAADGAIAATLPPIGGPVACVRFSTDGRTLAAATGDWVGDGGGRVLLWDGRAWSPLEADFRAAAVAFTAEGLVVAAWDGRVGLYDPVTGASLGFASVTKDAVSAEAFCSGAGGFAALHFEPQPPTALASVGVSDAVDIESAQPEAGRSPFDIIRSALLSDDAARQSDEITSEATADSTGPFATSR